MLDLNELEQLTAFADLGTLSKTADALHISQPTLTRTMQHIEETFGVPLFIRGKNRITLNETGQKAVAYARQLLADARNAIEQVRSYDRKLHTIAVESCAPAPLWTLLPRLAEKYPEQTISSKLVPIPDIIQNVKNDACQIGILPFFTEDDALDCTPFLRESLSICVTKDHALSGHSLVKFEMLNGFNFLLRSEIGFWNEMCRQKMPASRFLVQQDDYEFRELIRSSTLPCFTTNLATDLYDVLEGREIIPVDDAEADVMYHVIRLKGRITI